MQNHFAFVVMMLIVQIFRRERRLDSIYEMSNRAEDEHAEPIYIMKLTLPSGVVPILK